MYDRKKWDELCLKVFLLSLFTEEEKKKRFSKNNSEKAAYSDIKIIIPDHPHSAIDR